ncbi:hypothetical protein ABQJ48_18110 [Paraburkholderia sp. DGU8]
MLIPGAAPLASATGASMSARGSLAIRGIFSDGRWCPQRRAVGPVVVRAVERLSAT